MESDLLMAVVIATALGFGFSNGVLDVPTFLSPLVSTRAVGPKVLLAGAGILNFAGAFLTLEVAITVSERIFDPDAIAASDGLGIVLAGLVGALAWTLVTSSLGLPPSSSHSLIGGLAGSTLAAVGLDGIGLDDLLLLALAPAVLAPLAAFLLGGMLIMLLYRALGGARPGPAGRSWLGTLFKSPPELPRGPSRAALARLGRLAHALDDPPQVGHERRLGNTKKKKKK